MCLPTLNQTLSIGMGRYVLKQQEPIMAKICETTSQPDPIDYNAARKRLHAISANPDVLAGCERAVLTDDFDDDFLTAIVATRISLAHVFQDRGAPFVPA